MTINSSLYWDDFNFHERYRRSIESSFAFLVSIDLWPLFSVSPSLFISCSSTRILKNKMKQSATCPTWMIIVWSLQTNIACIRPVLFLWKMRRIKFLNRTWNTICIVRWLSKLRKFLSHTFSVRCAHVFRVQRTSQQERLLLNWLTFLRLCCRVVVLRYFYFDVLFLAALTFGVMVHRGFDGRLTLF